MTLALVTLEDRRAVYALLDRYLDWLPPARLSVSRGDTDAKPGAGRWARCQTCGGTGRVAGVKQQPCRKDHDHWPYDHGCRPCPADCERGYLRLHGQAALEGIDPMLRQVRDEQVTEAHERAERRRYVDAQLVKLAALQRQHSGEESAGDDLTRAHDAKARLWRTGSFAHLEVCLELLALTSPLRMEALRVFVLERQFPPGARVRVRLDETVVWIAERMCRPILLPADARAEVSAWKHALQHGKTAAHRVQRAARDAEVVELSVVHGWSLRRIGSLYDLSPEGVRKIVNGHAGGEHPGVASGAAA